ncbi:zinc finger protein 169-like [Sitodiplosis mosellana]|uniref:zinc finger protein 169-like n=1 Tax=Sitodiplosis mosellana TaxID=263140 RepID=UPI002444F791|nr:zinc finger protein 169-like [Sitodiplosis mosellana]
MEPTTRDWMDLITEMIWVIERETKFTLRGIHEDFKQTGLSFDAEFRNHFLQFIVTRVAKTYDQFQIRLEFEELENRYDSGAMDSDGSFVEWKQSTGYNRQNHTPERPSVAQKRKKPDELDASNRTFIVKRPRIDGRIGMELDEEVDREPVVEEEKIDEAIDPQIEQNDEIAGAVETPQEVETNDNECLVSTQTITIQTAIVDVDTTPVDPVVDFKWTKKRCSRRLTRPSPGDKQAEDAGRQQTKATSTRSSILASALTRPAPASVKKARMQALTSAQDAEKPTKGSTDVMNQSSGTAPRPCAPKTNLRSSIAPTQKTLIVNGIKRYKCDECDYSNSRRDRISLHMLEHKEKPFRCKLCPKKFAEQDLLDIHLKVHQNKCSRCKKKFADKGEICFGTTHA